MLHLKISLQKLFRLHQKQAHQVKLLLLKQKRLIQNLPQLQHNLLLFMIHIKEEYLHLLLQEEKPLKKVLILLLSKVQDPEGESLNKMFKNLQNRRLKLQKLLQLFNLLLQLLRMQQQLLLTFQTHKLEKSLLIDYFNQNRQSLITMFMLSVKLEIYYS